MKRTYQALAIALATFALLFAVRSATAEESRGRVVGVDVDNADLVILSKVGERVVFKVDRECVITINGRPAGLEDLRENDEVIVGYRRSGFEMPLAYSILCQRR